MIEELKSQKLRRMAEALAGEVTAKTMREARHATPNAGDAAEAGADRRRTKTRKTGGVEEEALHMAAAVVEMDEVWRRIEDVPRGVAKGFALRATGRQRRLALLLLLLLLRSQSQR